MDTKTDELGLGALLQDLAAYLARRPADAKAAKLLQRLDELMQPPPRAPDERSPDAEAGAP